MTDIRLKPDAIAAGAIGSAVPLLALAALGAVAAPFLPDAKVGILASASATLFLVALFLVALGGRRALLRRGMIRLLEATDGDSDDPALLTDLRGAILWRNAAAERDFDTRLSRSLADPEQAKAALRARALSDGNASRLLPSGREGRLGVTRLAASDLLWRIESRSVESPGEARALDVESLPVPLLELDDRGTVAVANAAARALLGVGPEERPALSRLVEGLGRPIIDWIEDAFAGRAVLRPEVVRAVRPGMDTYVQITLDAVTRDGERRLIGVLNDATELKTLEAQFVQSQKMHAIGQLAGGIAHDFNNLLTAINGHCDLLLMRHDAGDPDYSDLEQINQNANRAASLVRQLLAYSRKQNLRPESIDLRDTLSDLTHLLNRLVGERVSLTFHHRRDLRRVRADRRQLEQVIMNLVVNARDAMPDGGGIEVETDMDRLEAPLVRDRVEMPAGCYAVIRVSDRGVGIAPDKLDKIFEPFFTTKKPGEGTGLGLSTAYGIVKQSGGYIFADSEVGVGTTFTLYFPAQAENAQPDPVPTAKESFLEQKGSGTVLLVEDEASVRAFAARALRMSGFTVIESDCAETALDVLADPDLRIDVFLSDVIMPGRDGPSWVKEALEQRPGAAVIFMSGYAEESFAEQQATLPESRFLPKPFSLPDLISTVHECVEDGRPAQT